MASFLLRMTAQDEQFKVSWTIIDGDDTLAPPSYSVDAGLLQQAAANVRRQLQVIADARKPFERLEFANLLKQLAQSGRTLFKQLMSPANDQPDVLQRLRDAARDSNQIRAAKDSNGKDTNRIRHDLNIILETDKLFVPWGFVFSGDVSDVPKEDELKMSLADMKGFWLSHFNISVTYGGTSQFPRQRKTSTRKLFALHEVMFTEAKAVLKIEDKECLERLEKLLDGYMEPASDWNEFRERWEAVQAVWKPNRCYGSLAESRGDDEGFRSRDGSPADDAVAGMPR
jgi:hypothetical protein